MVEWSIDSRKAYADPFNDVDVDVVFSRGKQSWRVPTFWHGGNRWTVRFAPPEPGEYAFHLESTDRRNADLNGHGGRVTITAYRGLNPLLRHGMLRVSANRRYFTFADGTPFYWLGDTWWMGLSDRLPWDGFQQLTADRKAKGFTVVQLTAGLVPFEEKCPEDPGCANEGGPAWEAGFARINPGYFDAADRRIQALIDAGIVPEIEGTYQSVLAQTGVAKMKQHWRYIIARYSAYPVLWNLADEATDPPPAIAARVPQTYHWLLSQPGAWTEIARYIRAIDPNHHLLTVNEWVQPVDFPLQDESLIDFDQLQPGHMGWPSIGNEVMQLNKRYSRTDLTKPVVVGEIGYEQIFNMHYEDFQRMGFWLAMVNGAAGYTYGSAPAYEVNNPDTPLHRIQYTFQTWQEGMTLPGAYQVSLGARLLQNYPWWELVPHPEWVTPHGTTLLEPHSGRHFNPDNFNFALMTNPDGSPTDDFLRSPETIFPGGEWQERHGTFRRPYAAGIPGKLRVVYTSGLIIPPTVLDLEQGVRYQAFYWEPTLGIKFDLGTVEVPPPGVVQLEEHFQANSAGWSERGTAKAQRGGGALIAEGETVSVVDKVNMRDSVVSVDALSTASAAILLRYVDADNYVAAVYSAADKLIYLMTRSHGVDGGKLGVTPVPSLGAQAHLRAEARSKWGAASITDGQQTYSTPIVDVGPPVPPLSVEMDDNSIAPGTVGLWHLADGQVQRLTNFSVRQSPTLTQGPPLQRRLYDARGGYRGELSGPAWDEWGRHPAILLNAYRPERYPTTEDWVLVLTNTASSTQQTSKQEH